jgi:hypothetical protein
VNGHDHALELAAAAIDFRLTPSEQTSLDTHLNGCPACRGSVAGFATDAGTIAHLPMRALSPERSDLILASVLRPTVRVPVLRYLAIAALLALLATTSLVVGAELVRRLDAPRQLAVEPPPTAEPTQQSTTVPPPTPSASLDTRSTAPSQERATAPPSSPATIAPADAPPTLDARWWRIADAESVPNPHGYFTSVAELDGRLYAVSVQQGDPSAFHLWTSTDTVTWAEIDTAGYAPGRIASDGSRLIAIPDFGGPDTRASTDGRSWQPLSGIGADDTPVSLAGTGTVVFATGQQGRDGAIWHLNGDTWEPASLDNAVGSVDGQDGAPVVVHRLVATSSGWLAVGQGPSRTGSGYPEARAWTSVGGEIWAAEVIPGSDGTSAIGAWGSWPDTEVIVGGAIPANGRAVAWVRRGDAWEAATFHGAAVPAGKLGPTVEVNGVLLAAGYDDASQRSEGGELRSVLWMSSDGADWWPFESGDLSTGLLDDVIVTRDGRILGVGRQFDGPATRGFESAYGPAVFELIPGG